MTAKIARATYVGFRLTPRNTPPWSAPPEKRT